MTVSNTGSTGIILIDAEREKQIGKGYDTEHDHHEHSVEELLRIGACYLEAAASDMEDIESDWPHPFWPSDSTIPMIKEDNPLEYAIKGAAFVAAAIDLIYYETGQEKSRA